MAFKDILVYLDPTAKWIERLSFAVDLAKAHGARLVGVDVSAATGEAEAESSGVTRQLFDEPPAKPGVKAVFVPAEKPGEGTPSPIASISSCAGAGRRGARPHPAWRARPRAPRIRRADADHAARLDRRQSRRQCRHRLERRAGGAARHARFDAVPGKGAQGDRILLLRPSQRPARLGRHAGRASRGPRRLRAISDWTNTGDLTAIEALFASLDTQDADLIVAGAFGHSRLYEGLFGGSAWTSCASSRCRC